MSGGRDALNFSLGRVGEGRPDILCSTMREPEKKRKITFFPCGASYSEREGANPFGNKGALDVSSPIENDLSNEVKEKGGRSF